MNNLLLILCYCAVSYLNGFLAVNVVDPIKKYPHLPDLGFTYLPQIPLTYPNHSTLLFSLYFCLRLARAENKYLLLRFLKCITLLFAIRAITFTVTIEPPTLEGCYGRNPGEPFIWNIISILINTSDNTCLDLMFSGHACYYVTMYLFLLSKAKYLLEKIVISAWTFMGLLSIIASHLHYSDDVIIGIILSVLVYAQFGTSALLMSKQKYKKIKYCKYDAR